MPIMTKRRFHSVMQRLKGFLRVDLNTTDLKRIFAGDRSKYMPHQSDRECDRRRMQLLAAKVREAGL